MEPAEALAAVENSLRLAVRSVLGDSWTQQVAPALVKKVEKYRASDVTKRDGVAINDDLLAYTEFPELIEIILGDYAKFEPIFGTAKRRRPR